MTSLKPSVAWWCFARGEMTPEALVKAVAGHGYAGVELAPQEHWSMITDAGLTVATAPAHASLVDGLNRPENHDRIEREIHASLALAQRWRTPVLICFSGNRGVLDDEAGAEQTAIGLRRVARAAEEANVTLALELLNSKVDHPDYQCDRTEWGVKVCEWVDSPCVKLLYDVYHMQIMEGDIIRTIQVHRGQIAHYHIAGNPGRQEPDDSQELNYPVILRAVRATGYDGYIGIEFVPRGDPIAALESAIQLLRDEV